MHADNDLIREIVTKLIRKMNVSLTFLSEMSDADPVPCSSKSTPSRMVQLLLRQ